MVGDENQAEFRCPSCGTVMYSFKELIEHQKTCGSGGADYSDQSHPFVHLHSHTEFSILDTVGVTKEMVKRAAELNMPALAITDHGTISGHVVFQQSCNAMNVKPIFGCEFYIAEDMNDKGGYKHLTVLAKDDTGYQNLMKLASLANTEGFYYKPRIDFNLLEKYSEGLVVMSACLGGIIAKTYSEEGEESAETLAQQYQNLFGDDFYIEIMPNRLDDQVDMNPKLVDIAQRNGINLVATNDCHYPYPDDWQAHEVIYAIRNKASMNDPNRPRLDDNTFYIKDAQDMKESFENYHPSLSEEVIDTAMQNTLAISEKCDFQIKDQEVALPEFVLPEGFDSEADYLDHLAWQGIEQDHVKQKMVKHASVQGTTPEEAEKEYKDKLAHELDVVHELGFERYFLIVWDIYEFCRTKRIFYGPGRGSVAGSLLAYVIGITTVDPIENDLLFSRFLSKQRVDFPDIDMDFEDSRRWEVVQHLKDKYGEDKVSNIITFGTMRGKMILKDVARAFDVPYAEVNKVTPFIVERSGGDARVSFTVQDSIDSFDEVKKFSEKYPQVIKFAQRLEGQIRQKGIHAAGIIVSNVPLMEACPIEYKDGILCTAVDGISAENMGLLKLDILGLKNMTIVANTVHKIEENHGKRIEVEKIPLDDEKVFEEFNKGHTAAVFQFETRNFTKLVRQVKVESFADIVLTNALGRPGTMRSGLASRCIRIKHGKIQASYAHPLMKPITEPTFGILLYQEQIMKVLAQIGNFEWSAVDIHRKIISKSQGTSAFEKARDKFVKGAIENGLDEEEAHNLYTQMIQFGSYSFNKSHSAAYSTISYWCQWFKVYYPNEFFASAISASTDKKYEYIREARKFGVEFQPPDVNESDRDFTIKKDKILCGLNGIYNLGDKGIDVIIENRPYKNFHDFIKKVPKNKVQTKAIEAMIKIGCFGDPTNGGKKLLEDFQNGRDNNQMTFEDFMGGRQIDDWTLEEVARFQSTLYTLPPAVHKIESYDEFLEDTEVWEELSKIDEIEYDDLDSAQGVIVRGVITEVRYQNWGDKLPEKPEPDHPMYNYYMRYEWMARHCLFDLEDETGFTLVSAYPDVFSKYEDIINKGAGTPVLVKGYIVPTMQRIYAKEIFELDDLKNKVDIGEELNFEEQKVINHPLRQYQNLKASNISDIADTGSVVAIVDKPKEINDRRGRKMAFVPIHDLTGEMTLILFADDWDANKDVLQKDKIIGANVAKMPTNNGKVSYKPKKIIEIE